MCVCVYVGAQSMCGRACLCVCWSLVRSVCTTYNLICASVYACAYKFVGVLEDFAKLRSAGLFDLTSCFPPCCRRVPFHVPRSVQGRSVPAARTFEVHVLVGDI